VIQLHSSHMYTSRLLGLCVQDLKGNILIMHSVAMYDTLQKHVFLHGILGSVGGRCEVFHFLDCGSSADYC
jgi:hypothetical protein